MKGKKHDGLDGKHAIKPMYHLLPWREIDEIVRVLTFGAKKYGENDWKAFIKRNDNDRRYFSAAMRHLVEHKQGIKKDEETGYSHLSHACCCLLFIMWNEKEKELKKCR